MKFNIPGKTYLVGEYAVLLGGSALGLSTDPSFSFETGTGVQSTVHPDSPAGRYLQKNSRQFIDGELHDPYRLGGFGRSTAEYWSAVLPDLVRSQSSLSKILTEYKSLHTGSGVDLAFQFLGEVSHVHVAEGFYEKLQWPFKNLDFFIVSTGTKINTHEHIRQLDMNLLKDLPKISARVVDAFKSADENVFVAQLSRWTNKLAELGLTHSNSIKLKKNLEHSSAIKLVKPCGALGADVLLVLFHNSNSLAVKKVLSEQNIPILASSINLAPGVEMQLTKYRNLSSEACYVD